MIGLRMAVVGYPAYLALTSRSSPRVGNENTPAGIELIAATPAGFARRRDQCQKG
jgi:hypothetical protein